MIKLAMTAETQSHPICEICHDVLSGDAVSNNDEEKDNPSGNFAMLSSRTFHECCINEWAKCHDNSRHNIKLACPTCKRSTEDVQKMAADHPGPLIANSDAMATDAMPIEVASEAEPQLAAGPPQNNLLQPPAEEAQEPAAEPASA